MIPRGAIRKIFLLPCYLRLSNNLYTTRDKVDKGKNFHSLLYIKRIIETTFSDNSSYKAPPPPKKGKLKVNETYTLFFIFLYFYFEISFLFYYGIYNTNYVKTIKIRKM